MGLNMRMAILLFAAPHNTVFGGGGNGSKNKKECDPSIECCLPSGLEFVEPITVMFTVGLILAFAVCFLGFPYKRRMEIGSPASEMKSLVFKTRYKYKMRWRESSDSITLNSSGAPGELSGVGSDDIGEFSLKLTVSPDGGVTGKQKYKKKTGDRKENMGQQLDLSLTVLTHWSSGRSPGMFGTYSFVGRRTSGEWGLGLASELPHKESKSVNDSRVRYFHPLRSIAAVLCTVSALITILGDVISTTFTAGGGGIWAPLALFAVSLVPNNVHNYAIALSYAIGICVTCAVVYTQLTAVGILNESDTECGVVGDGGLFETHCSSHADQGCALVKPYRGQCTQEDVDGFSHCVGMSSSSLEDLEGLKLMLRLQVYTLLPALLLLCLHFRARLNLTRNPNAKDVLPLMLKTSEHERLCTELYQAACVAPPPRAAAAAAAARPPPSAPPRPSAEVAPEELPVAMPLELPMATLVGAAGSAAPNPYSLQK